MTKLPFNAERLGHEPIKTERVPSRYAAGADALRAYVACPGCGLRTPAPSISEPFMCVGTGNGCGLMMQIECDGLYIWRERATAEAAE